MNHALSQRLLSRLSFLLSVVVGAPMAIAAPCDEFEDLSIILEQNATDGDSEVVFFAKGQDEGIVDLRVFAPNGQLAGVFRAQGANALGGREFALESPEPPEAQIILDAFPEGSYTVRGRTSSRSCLLGQANLSHQFAPATDILSPLEDEIVAPQQMVVTWIDVSAATSYIVEITNEETDDTVLVTVPASRTEFIPPQEWLESGTEYSVQVGVVTQSGNKTFVESAFFTAGD